MKFCIEEVEGLYYPCSENKGADQLCSYCTADLRLCFRLCMLLVFLCGGSYVTRDLTFSVSDLFCREKSLISKSTAFVNET